MVWLFFCIYVTITTIEYCEGGYTMKKFVCTVCGYVYDEAVGEPDNGIEAGTAWADVPEDYLCPLCGVGKDQFEEEA